MKTISCQIETDMLIYNSVVKTTPACRNGRRGRLKICCGQPRMGSSPIAGSNVQSVNPCFYKSLRIFSFLSFDYSYLVFLLVIIYN